MPLGPFNRFSKQNALMAVKCLGGGKCVGYVGRFGGIWAVTTVEGGRGDSTCRQPVGIENLKNYPF